ncbi:hypothetical protein RUM43_008512 [Polyplax serrata]|uniref:Uncharacterized protein n=1 Tax=Polyplax serrata TaxID=468196 RepID=A0AAN8S3W7_POLSC
MKTKKRFLAEAEERTGVRYEKTGIILLVPGTCQIQAEMGGTLMVLRMSPVSLSTSDIKRRPSLDPQGCVDSVYLACWSSSMVWALGLRRWEPVRPSKINL